MKNPSVVVLPVGTGWPGDAESGFESMVGKLPERISVERLTMAFCETDIVRSAESVCRSDAGLLLLPALHGASARALTLAAQKSGIPAVIWCHDERHSLASSAIASETLRQIGCRHALLHGDCAGELASAAAAAHADSVLRSARIGCVGPAHFNLSSVQTNFTTFLRRFGVWLVPVALSYLMKLYGEVTDSECAVIDNELRQRCAVSASPVALSSAIRVYLALRHIAEENGLDAVAVDCWNEILPSFGASPCLGFCFDDFRVACEGDPVLATTLLAGEAICGSIGYVGDIYSLDENDGTASLMHCGGCASLHSGEGKMEIADQTPPGSVKPSDSVIACRPVLPGGTGTCLILHGENLDCLHLRRCEILRTDFSNQMRVFVRIEGDLRSFRKQLAGNHYVVFPGDSLNAWRLWADWNGIAVH